MSNTSILFGGRPPTNIPAASLYNPIAGPQTDQPISFPRGTPVAPDSTAPDPEAPGVVIPAVADTAADAFNVVGFAATPGVVGHPVNVQSQGPLTLAEDEWRAITHDGSALIHGLRYFLAVGPATGKITSAPPVGPGESVTFVGVALSSTEFMILIDRVS